jgi:peptidoglycan hydrolase-like protein with peptidoglycan-binding domain
MRDLFLTTPHVRGDDVSHLQELLRVCGYLKDKVDGEFGIMTAQAVHRAKYWLGYRKPDQHAGELLVSYLAGVKKPSLAMRSRARLRKKRASEVPLRVKAYRALAAHEGEKEKPRGSNKIPFASLWYGMIGAWCAMAVSRAYVDAGSKVFKKGVHYSYVPFLVGDAKAGKNNLTVTRHPEQGDIPCYDWDGDGEADHTGLFDQWVDGAEGSEFYAMEGNTAEGNDSNGGEVMHRHRKVSQVQVFVHVGG